MKQVINIGTVANDGTGDPLRTAFTKANENFTEVYDAAAAAQSTADTGVTNAATALAAANEADDTADAAQATANTAVTNAATAQSAANAAQSTANTALTNAATAQTTVNTLAALPATVVSRVAARVTAMRSNPLRLNNVCRGTVGSAINSSATSLTVDAVASVTAPLTGIFAIRIDEEDMMVTAGAGTTTWTVTRGINTTIAAAHSAGAVILCGPLSLTFPPNFHPSHGDVSSNRKIYPTPTATTGATVGVWQIPEILWQPFPSAMWQNQASSTTLVSNSNTLYSQNLNRVTNDAATLISGLPQAHFVFNGSTLDMLYSTANVTQLHMLVDEGEGWRLPFVGAIANWGSPSGKWVSFNFGSRKTRRISLYGDGTPCGSQGYFGAFGIGTKDIMVADPRTTHPTCAIFSDSLMQQYTTFGRGGAWAELAHRLGLHVQNWNLRGGTGYLANNATANADGYTRLQNELARWSPEVIIVSFGQNDNPADGTTLTTITNFYAHARTTLPNSLIIVIGALRTKESEGTGRNPLNVRILQALQAISGPWVFVNPNGSTASQNAWYASNGASGDLVSESWSTGNGRVGTTTGIGNRDIFYNTDDAHPVLIGSDYFADRAYQSTVEGISSLVGYRLS